MMALLIIAVVTVGLAYLAYRSSVRRDERVGSRLKVQATLGRIEAYQGMPVRLGQRTRWDV
jgi:Tfp pilus assembly protein PilE